MIPLYTRPFSDVFQHSALQLSAKHPTFMIARLSLLRIAHSFEPIASAHGQRKAQAHALNGIFFNHSAVFLPCRQHRLRRRLLRHVKQSFQVIAIDT